MKKIIIVVAMQSEYNLVAGILANATEQNIDGITYSTGIIADKEVVLLQSGIGKVNAAIRVTELIFKEQPDCVINSGVAGGIGAGLHPGDVVIGTECCYHDVWCGEGQWGQIQGLPLKFKADERLVGAARQIDDNRLRFGLICTGDQFISDLDTLNAIKRNFPDGQAVDMESAAIAQACHLKKTPFMSVRVVSDTPGMEHDNTSQYFDFFKDAPKATFKTLQQLISKL